MVPGDDSSAAANEMDAAAAEYQMFLDFAGEELGLFHGGFSLYPPADGLFAEFQ